MGVHSGDMRIHTRVKMGGRTLDQVLEDQKDFPFCVFFRNCAKKFHPHYSLASSARDNIC